MMINEMAANIRLQIDAILAEIAKLKTRRQSLENADLKAAAKIKIFKGTRERHGAKYWQRGESPQLILDSGEGLEGVLEFICAFFPEQLDRAYAEHCRANESQDALTSEDERRRLLAENERQLFSSFAELEKIGTQLEEAGFNFDRPSDMPIQIFLGWNESEKTHDQQKVDRLRVKIEAHHAFTRSCHENRQRLLNEELERQNHLRLLERIRDTPPEPGRINVPAGRLIEEARQKCDETQEKKRALSREYAAESERGKSLIALFNASRDFLRSHKGIDIESLDRLIEKAAS
jgi:hypothetical protein